MLQAECHPKILRLTSSVRVRKRLRRVLQVQRRSRKSRAAGNQSTTLTRRFTLLYLRDKSAIHKQATFSVAGTRPSLMRVSPMNALLQAPRAPHRHYLRRLAFALLIAVGAGAAASVLAHGPSGMAWHHGAGSSEDVGNHVAQMAQLLYADVDVSDAQKAQIDPLVQQAVADLAPLHSELHDSHANMLAVLGAETVDRTAIETMRIAHIRAMDQ